MLKENKSIERLRQKQEKEMMTLIQNEFRNEINRRQNQKKLISQHEEDDKLFNGKCSNQSTNHYEKDNERVIYSNQDFKKNKELILKEKQEKIQERKKKYVEKENEKRLIIEEKLKIKVLNSLNKKEQRKKKVEITMKNINENVRKRSHELEHKQIRNETKMIEFEESKQIKLVEQKNEALKKSQQILQVLEKNKELENLKIKEYYDKKAMIFVRKQELVEIKLQDQKLKDEKSKERQIRIYEAIQNNEIQKNEKRGRTLEKILAQENKVNLNDQQITLNEIIKKEKSIKKRETKSLKLFLRSKNIKKVNVLHENAKDRSLKRVEENFAKFKNFTFEKQNLIETKRKITYDFTIKKSEILKRLEQIFQKNRISDDVILELYTMFKDNDEILKLIKSLKETECYQPEKSRSFLNSQYSISKTNKNNEVIENKGKEKGIFTTEIQANYKIEDNYCRMQKSREVSENKYNNTFNIKPLRIHSDNDISCTSKRPQTDKRLFPNHISKSFKDIPKSKLSSSKQKKIIEKEINNYRFILNKELLLLLKDERNKEKERDLRIRECSEEDKKIKLDKLFSIERVIASNKILNFNK